MKPEYDFDRYLSEIKEKDYFDILKNVEQLGTNVERSSFGCNGAVGRREAGSLDFSKKSGELLWWLRTGTKPGSCSDLDFQKFKPLCERLVAKGQLKPSALQVFET